MKSPKKFSSSIFNVQSRKKEKSEETYGSIEELNEGLISNPIIPIVRSEIEDDGRSPPPQHIPVQKRNAQIEYDPFDWRKTLLVARGRPMIGKAYFIVCLIGSGLVILSKAAGIGLEKERECRAWCSKFSLGQQPHAYMGFILFLLMTFRTQQSYKHYVRGQSSFYEMKCMIRKFVNMLLNGIPRDSLSKERRARILAHVITFPFVLTSELRRERDFDRGPLRNIISDGDLRLILSAPSMTSFILESLSQMIHNYGENIESPWQRKLQDLIASLYKPYSEAERISENPMGFAYVTHVRLLLVLYLISLPLALVEQLGYSTIPVFWVISYALMSVEMLAVEVESPFGYQGSDLRLYQYNILTRDLVLQSWKHWCDGEGDFQNTLNYEEEYKSFGYSHTDEGVLEGFDYW